jgi:MFS family permease
VNNREKAIIRLTFLGHSFVHLLDGIIPPLIPLLMVQFRTGYFRMGLVVTVFSYAFGLGALPAGFFVDRIGPRRLIAIFFIGSGLLALMVGMVSSFGPYLAVMGTLGLFCSLYHPAGTTLIGREIAQPGRAFGIHGIAGSVGISAAPLLTAFLGTRFGWVAPHILFGILGIVLGVLALGLPGKDHQFVKKQTGADVNTAASGVSWPVLFVSFASFAVLGMGYKAMTAFLPAYMAHRVPAFLPTMDPVTAGGAIATITLLIGGFGQYFGGRTTDRIPAELVYTVSSLIASVTALMMAYATGVMLLTATVLHSMFSFAVLPVQSLIVSRYLADHRLGLGFGIKYFMVFGFGSLGAALSGFLADQFGLSAVFIAVAAFFLIGAAMGLFLYHQFHNRPVVQRN